MDSLLMSETDYEKKVIDYLMAHYPVKKRWFRSEIKQITPEWSLNEDFQFTPEDAEEFLIDVFTAFNVDYSQLDTRNYLEYEYPFWQQTFKKRIKPLTVAMIIESVKAGRWLYD
jgi:hypothetical protein